ncbi:MAG: hypothetical protein Q4C52_04345 [Eubacteriales bacterium]|nr:hypothetical protein [Eubacteriales bacterium]
MDSNKRFSGTGVKDEQEIRDYTTKQYACGHSCRICPYPGAKCREDEETARRIQ